MNNLLILVTLGIIGIMEKPRKKHLDPVLEALQNLDAQVAQVSEDSKYQKHRAVRHARTTTSTQSRVKLMALLESAVMILAAVFQLFFVISFPVFSFF